MCIMEMHDKAHRTTMVQAVAHNLSTIDRDLDMLRKVAESRKDVEMLKFVDSIQIPVNKAYALGLTEFGLYCAQESSDHEGHVHGENGHHGHERTFEAVVANATKAAKRDETR